MKTRKVTLLFVLLTACFIYNSSNAQRILVERISYYDVKTPNNPFDASVKTYNVIIETPYTLTVEDVRAQSLVEFEETKANYAKVLEESKTEYQTQLANYDEEVRLANERYDKEMADFKDLTLIERLALTEQGKKPTLKTPSKPRYVEPLEPRYVEPNLDDHLIFDNDVLADGFELLGFEKGQDVLFLIKVSKMAFQDNGGQTFYNQPTTLKVMKGAELIDEKTFDEEFKFLTSSSSNTINLDRYEKNNVNKIMSDISNYMNEEFGFIPVSKTIAIEYPKNRKREYDVLENAKIKAISAYRKLKQDTSSETRERALAELEDIKKIWKSELVKVDYKDKKAQMNAEIGRMILFNLLRVDLSLKDKVQAEETLSLIQDKLIDLDLNYDEKREFTALEEQVYKL
jgi:hypothetical protein